MKLNKISTSIGLVASSILLMSHAPAQAFNFNTPSSLGSCSGMGRGSAFTDSFSTTIGNFSDTTMAECETSDGFKIVAGDISNKPGVLQGRVLNDVYGIGVSQGGNDVMPGQINPGEFIDLILDAPKALASLDFAFLFRPGIYGDKVYEISAVAPNLPGISGTLTVKDATTAIWAWTGGSQTVTAKSPSTENGAGWYSILNPFGDQLISSLRLTAPSAVSGRGDNDYALVGATTKVPEPATMLGLGLVAGAMAVSRKRQQLRKAS